MGLDSVELLVRFEKYFEVEIPDDVAETLSTPADTATWISHYLGVATDGFSPGRKAIERQLQMLFAASAPIANTKLADLLPTGDTWGRYAQQLADQAGWKLPEIGWLRPPRARGWLNQLFNWVTTIAPPNPNPYRFADLIDWTLARNYELLLPKPWQNQSEVLQAVMGITSDSSGVEISEIKPDSHFVYDLGID